MPKQRVNITISPELIAKLQTEADAHCHSLSNEIEYRLKQSFTPTSSNFTPTPFTPISTPENPTGQLYTPTAHSNTIITADGTTHKKHPLLWLQENNIDPNDTSYDTYKRFRQVFPDINIHEFDNYQQQRRN